MVDEFTLDDDSLTVTPTSIDDTDSPYTTQGEQYINVDTSSGPVTVELASADVQAGRTVNIHDDGENASSNAITVTTEGSATIAPGGQSSITLSVDGSYVRLECNGTDWLSDRAAEKDSVSTDKLSGDWGGKLMAFADGEMNSIDPSSTAAPLQDAIDWVTSTSSGAGSVVIPNGGFTEGSRVTMDSKVSVVGRGSNYGYDGSEILFSDPNDAGFYFPSFVRSKFGGFRIIGPGDNAATDPAIEVDGAFNTNWILPLEIEQWGAPAITQSSGKMFQNTWENVQARFVDPNGAAVVNLDAGADSVWHNLAVYPTAEITGSNSTGLWLGGGMEMTCTYLAVGGAAGPAVVAPNGNAGFISQDVRIEPANQQSNAEHVVRGDGKAPMKIGRVNLNGGTYNYVYDINNFGDTPPANKYLGGVNHEAGTIQSNIVRVGSDTEPIGSGSGRYPVIYEGVSAQVDNTSGGALAQPVPCLGDLSTVQ